MELSGVSLFARVSHTLRYTGGIGLAGGFLLSVSEQVTQPEKPIHDIPIDMCTGALIGFTWPVSVPLLGGYGLYRRIGWRVTVSTRNRN